MTLKGPADADHFRVKVGRFGDRWYTDPLASDDIAVASDWQGPSVSATKPPFANKYVPMKTIAELPDTEWTRLAGLSTTDRYEAVKAADKRAGRINMSRGTLVHQWAEDLIAGRPIVDQAIISGDAAVLEQARRFRPALEAFFDTYQPEPIAVECVCLHRSLNGVGYGGTADLFARIEGDVWAVDWKSRTSDHGCYLEEAAQGGAYIGAEYMIVDHDGQAARARIPDVAGVLIVSITDDSFRPYPIDAGGAIEAYRAMHAWWVAQRRVVDDKIIGRPWAPKTAAGEVETSGTTAAATPAAASAKDELRRRVTKLIEGGYEQAVRLAWPQGVPTLGQEHTAEQLAELDHAVARVERDVSAPFDPPPSEPVKPRPVVEVEAPSPIDEGGDVEPGDVKALEEALAKLPDEIVTEVSVIAADARFAGRSLSVAQRPSVRRWEIARALITAADTGPSNYLDVVTAAAADIGTTAQHHQAAADGNTLGALLSLFTISQARQLADAFAESAAA